MESEFYTDIRMPEDFLYHADAFYLSNELI